MKRLFNVYKEDSSFDDDDFVTSGGGGVVIPPVVVTDPVITPEVVPSLLGIPDPAEPLKDPITGDVITDDNGFDLGRIIPILADEIDTPLPSDMDFDSFSKELGIESDAPITNKDEFKSAFQKNLERQKTIVKFEMDKYGDEAIQLAEFLSSNGSLKDFLDPVKDYNELLAMPNDLKMKTAFIAQGFTEQVAQDKVLELMESNTLETEAKKVTDLVTASRDSIIKDIIAKSEKVTATRTEQIEQSMTAEKEIYKAKVKELTTFMGVALNEIDKKAIISHIESGAFFAKIKSNPEAFINAYLHSLIGDKVTQYHENNKKEAQRLGYNDADAKGKMRLRTTPNVPVGGGITPNTTKGLGSMDG